MRDYLGLGQDTIDSIVGNDQKGIRPLDSRWVAMSTYVPYIYCGERKLKIV